jgi:fumarate reductase subunit D
MILHWPQITYLLLVALSLWIGVGRHGTMKTGKHDARADIVRIAVGAWLLYQGGFFAGVTP